MENPLYQFAPDGTCLIETLGYRRDEGCRYLDLHLARLQRSAQALEFKVDIKAIRTRLQAIKSATPLRLRWRKTDTARSTSRPYKNRHCHGQWRLRHSALSLMIYGCAQNHPTGFL